MCNCENKDDTVTKDLARFGWRERLILESILVAWREHGLPSDFEEDEVVPMFNMNSGNVFLVNAEYQTAMLADEKLVSWYNCPECGHEGFFGDMKHGNTKACKEYYKEIKKNQ